MPSPPITRENIKQVLPCFGHYAVNNCYNLGFCQYKLNPATGIKEFPRCPFERLCKKESLKYAENMDVYNSGQIDKPRQIIRQLKK
jgi:hypothetical protein